MNYNHDTEMDLGWAKDQLRRQRNLVKGVQDAPIRRLTPPIPQAAVLLSGTCHATAAQLRDTTLGEALSALSIGARAGPTCCQICRSILALLSDRDRLGVHAEFLQLKGLEAILGVLREHEGEAALAALQILDKLSRTSAREIAASGGVDLCARACALPERREPRVLEAALRALHGLSFDAEARAVLLRSGVLELAEEVGEAARRDRSPDEDDGARQAWQDVLAISLRLSQRVGGPDRRKPQARA